MDREDSLALLGCACVVVGLGLWSLPVALVVLGIFLLLAAMMTAISRARRQRTG